MTKNPKHTDVQRAAQVASNGTRKLTLKAAALADALGRTVLPASKLLGVEYNTGTTASSGLAAASPAG